MGALRIFLASLMAASIAAPALAADDDWPVLKSVRMDDVPPWAAFVVYPVRGRPSTGVSLYSIRQDTDGPLVMIARRVRTVEGAAGAVDWANSASCPALVKAAVEMEDLPAPRIDAPGVGRTPKDALLAEGDSYFLWASLAAYAGGAKAEIEVRTVDGTPVSDWIDRTLKGMESCWGGGEAR